MVAIFRFTKIVFNAMQEYRSHTHICFKNLRLVIKQASWRMPLNGIDASDLHQILLFQILIIYLAHILHVSVN